MYLDRFKLGWIILSFEKHLIRNGDLLPPTFFYHFPNFILFYRLPLAMVFWFLFPFKFKSQIILYLQFLLTNSKVFSLLQYYSLTPCDQGWTTSGKYSLSGSFYQYACAVGGAHLPIAHALCLPEPTKKSLKIFESFILFLTKLKLRKNNCLKIFGGVIFRGGG